MSDAAESSIWWELGVEEEGDGVVGRRLMVLRRRRKRRRGPACRTEGGNATEVKMWAEGTSPDLSQQATKVGGDME